MTGLAINNPTLPAALPAMPIPYTLQSDPWVTGLILACFFLTAWVLARSRGFLWQRGKDFLLNRDRPDLFSTSVGNDITYQLLLLGQSCILTGLYLFVCYQALYSFSSVSSTWKWIGTYVMLAALFFFVKWLAYLFCGWIFLDKGKTSAWVESYATLLYYLGLALFFVVLSAVYFVLSFKIILIAGAVLFLFLKILTLYKWIKLFCVNLYGCFFVILYFCALEIIPCLLLYRGLEQLNNHLIVKY